MRRHHLAVAATLLTAYYETDDEVVVLTPVANTVEEHQPMVERGFYGEEGQVDSLMVQEWPLYGVGRKHFAQLSYTVNQYVHEPLKARGSESVPERKGNLLRAFGRALQKALSAPGGPFLAIFNPDPGLEDLALCYCIARLINPPGTMLDLYVEHVEGTLQANGTTLQKVLRELKAKGTLIQAL